MMINFEDNENNYIPTLKAKKSKKSQGEKAAKLYSLYKIDFVNNMSGTKVYDLEIKGDDESKNFIKQIKKSYFNCTILKIKKIVKTKTVTVYES